LRRLERNKTGLIAPQMVDNKYREAMNLLAGYRKYTNESNRTGHD